MRIDETCLETYPVVFRALPAIPPFPFQSVRLVLWPPFIRAQLCNVGAWTVMASVATRMGIMEIAAHQLMLSLWLVIGFMQGGTIALNNNSDMFCICGASIFHEHQVRDEVLVEITALRYLFSFFYLLSLRLKSPRATQ